MTMAHPTSTGRDTWRDTRVRIIDRANQLLEHHRRSGIVDPDELRLRSIVGTLRTVLPESAVCFSPDSGWPEPLRLLREDRIDCDPGSAYEVLLGLDVSVVDGTARFIPRARGARTGSGTFYTPIPLVEHVLDHALDPILDGLDDPDETSILSIRVCDPACGSGRFLACAARRLAARLREITGEPESSAISRVIDRCIYGVDLDRISVELCITALVRAGGSSDSIRDHIRFGNSLLGVLDPAVTMKGERSCDAWCAEYLGSEPLPSDHLFHWGLEFPEVFERDGSGFDVIVGNPPFLNQLTRATASDRRTARLLSACCDDAVGGYADLSIAFLVRSMQLCAKRGRVSLVLPQSVLVSDDAGAARKAVLETGAIQALWISNEHVFDDAGVYTCAVTLEKCGERTSKLIRTHTGAFESIDPIQIQNDTLRDEPTWGRLSASTLGVPDLVVSRDLTIGDIAHATADFRDQYYGLKGHVRNSEDINETDDPIEDRYPRLLTSGLIDPACSLWGERTTRIHKQTWRSPRIHRAGLSGDTKMSSWIDIRLVPKVLLATQTRVMEAYVDSQGIYVPSVPIVSLMPFKHDDLWSVGAAVASPVSTMIACRDYFGAALSIGAIKLSAKQALRLPLPGGTKGLERAAGVFREAHEVRDPHERQELLNSFGRISCENLGVSGRSARRLETWWNQRLGSRRG